ncbi:MAG TPA: hypothetical protein VJ281_01240 [Chthoniobacterales bacterium]|nr:hypothetical protein [Chthoniobacterales bacterium]
MNRPDFLKRAEWIVAVLLSAMSIFLLGVRSIHSGALWRDEVAVVNLARMPSITEITQNFQHEAFPIPFPLFVRAYTNVFGTSDHALRAFGFSAGIAVLAAIWLSARFIGRGPPLLALALLGLNATFLFWGTTVRGYGFGSALIILAFGLLASLFNEATPTRIIAATFVSVAAVQCLVHNLALIAAITGAATIACLVRHDFKRLIIFLCVLGVCMLSFIPYLGAYSSSWSQVVEFPVTLRFLWNQLNFALGNPSRAIAAFWHIAFVFLVAASSWRLLHANSEDEPVNRKFVLFGIFAAAAAPIAYCAFLETLSYLARSWYFLALISLLAIALDSIAAAVSSSKAIRTGLLIFAIIALIVFPINAWRKIHERQTNIDVVADKIAADAKLSDLIVLAPWQYGISFNRYYHGATPSITLPSIVDLRVHRYDLFREKMLSEHPIDEVLEKIQQSLGSGNRVWIVGGIKLPPEGRAPRALPPAPNAQAGWDNVAYSDAWMEQLGAFVREHSARGQTVPLPNAGPINPFENVPLMVIDGWQ